MKEPTLSDRFADLIEAYEVEPLESWATEDLQELEDIIGLELWHRHEPDDEADSDADEFYRRADEGDDEG